MIAPVDHVATALARLTSQFDKSERLRGLVAAMVGQLPALEVDAQSLREERWIETAIGAQLDGCGAIVGEARRGRDDEAYRAALRFRVFVNISKGTPTDLIRALKFLTSPTDCQYIELQPATAILFTDGLTIPSDVQAAIQELAPAGVSTVPVAVSYGAPPARFGREPPPGELFVNGGASYLTANGSDIQVTGANSAQRSGGFGGAIPSVLSVGGGAGLLDVGGFELAIYNPNTLVTVGQQHLSGVFS